MVKAVKFQVLEDQAWEILNKYAHLSLLSPPPPTETKPARPDDSSTSAKPKEPAAPASSPPDKTDEIRTRRVRGAYARRKHKEGGERCVQEYLKGKGKGAIEDLDDKDLKLLLDALDKLHELHEAGHGGGAWR